MAHRSGSWTVIWTVSSIVIRKTSHKADKHYTFKILLFCFDDTFLSNCRAAHTCAKTQSYAVHFVLMKHIYS